MSPVELKWLIEEHNRLNNSDAPKKGQERPHGKGAHGHISPFMTE